jgi:hypothetical protein
MWKKRSWPNLKYFSGETEESHEKAAVKLAGLRADIFTRDPPKKKHKCSHINYFYF